MPIIFSPKYYKKLKKGKFCPKREGQAASVYKDQSRQFFWCS